MKDITAVFLLVLSVGLFYTFTRPNYEAVQELSATASDYRGVLKHISDIIETRDRLLVSYASFPEEEIDRLSKALPSNIDTVRMALDLDSVASRYGIAIKNVSVDVNDNNQNTPQIEGVEGIGGGASYERAMVSISFVSNYQNFRRFVEDLERNLRIMNIRSVNFNSTENGLYEYMLTIETYWVR